MGNNDKQAREKGFRVELIQAGRSAVRSDDSARWGGLTLGGSIGIAIVCLLTVFQPSPAPAEAAFGVCNTFDSPGVNRFEVPAGVTSITAEVYGAQGGDVTGASAQFGKGGLGGGATGIVIPVANGDILNVVVGGAGIPSSGPQTPAPPGGTPGGGGAGAVGSAHTSATGGGASSITLNATTIAIVGAGGGGAHGGNGGAGGEVGEPGTKHPMSAGTSTPGLGGTAVAGGAGGTGDPVIHTGDSGGLGVGGDGGGAAAPLPIDGGGGGGGGFFGGGGGGGGEAGGNSATGGGGGSSFDSTGSATFQTGVETGDGRVRLFYDCALAPPPPPACNTFNQAGTSNFVVPAGVTEIRVAAFGAQGGDAPNANATFNGVGGLGGGVRDVDIPVTPLETLQIVIGGRGQNSPGTGLGAAGGSPGGGGDGGNGNGTGTAGAGGGGATSIMRGATTLVIAGAGGGAARGGDGGAGGALGTNGIRRNAVGGTLTVGGGAAGGLGAAGGNAAGTATAGDNGAVGLGGDGGDAPSANTHGGGGGGSGAIGGGGGVGAGGTAGGGGGGSSASNVPGAVTFDSGVETGDGRVTIAYDCADAKITKDATLVAPNRIEYTLTVENNGPNPATGVTVTDPLPDVTYVSDNCGGVAGAPWTWNVGNLAVGATATCKIIVSPNRAGTINNTATVDTNQVDLNPTNDSDPSSVYVPSVDLMLEKSASPDAVAPGGQTVYTLVVRNLGPDDATGVTLSDSAPNGIRFVSVAADQGSCQTTAGSLSCALGNLANGSATEVRVTAEVDSGARGTLVNSATTSADQRETNPNNNSDNAPVRVTEVDLVLSKSASTNDVEPGGQFFYTLIVRNDGPDDATGVTVTDSVPDGLRIFDVTPGQGTCLTPGNDVTCDLGDLPNGGSTQILVSAEVDPGARGTLENTASVSGNQAERDPTNNSDDATVRINPPPPPPPDDVDLEVTKRASEGEVSAGDQLTYTIVVTNNGPGDATDVTLVDTPPAGLDLASAEVSQGSCRITANVLRCSLGALAAGGQAQVLLTTNVTTAADSELQNVVTITAAESENKTTNNLDRQVVKVLSQQQTPPQPASDLRIKKQVSGKSSSARRTYTLTVKNLGPDTAADTVVTDTPAGLVEVLSVRTNKGSCQEGPPIRCELGNLGAGDTATITILVNVSEPGRLLNSASVSSASTDANTNNNLAKALTALAPSLGIEKTASKRNLLAGEDVRFKITVTNTGATTIRNVEVCDRMPSNLGLISSNPAARDDSSPYCWRIKRLAAGDRETFTIVANALPGRDGRAVNTATASAAAVGEVSDTATVVVSTPDTGPCPDRGAGPPRC